MNLLKSFVLLNAMAALLLSGSLWTGQSSLPGVAIGSEKAAVIRGGAECGSAWTSGDVSCAAGTVLCGEESEACGDVTITSLVSSGDGNEDEKDSETKQCGVCMTSTGHTACGSGAEVVTSTQEADCNTE